MPWEFSGETARLSVRPGEVKMVTFGCSIPRRRTMVGQAVPSVSPGPAAAYLKKVECFCFNRQELRAGAEQADAAQVLYRSGTTGTASIPSRFPTRSMTSRSRTCTGTRTEEMTMAKVNQTYYVPDQSRFGPSLVPLHCFPGVGGGTSGQ